MGRIEPFMAYFVPQFGLICIGNFKRKEKSEHLLLCTIPLIVAGLSVFFTLSLTLVP